MADNNTNLLACNVCGAMVPENNMQIHLAHACRGVARSSTQDDDVDDASVEEIKDDDDDVIDLSNDDSPSNSRKRQEKEAPPSSPPPRRRQRRGRPKRDQSEDAMEIDDSDGDDKQERNTDDDDDEVEIVNNPAAAAAAAAAEVVDLLNDGDDDEWACQRCTLLNDKNRSVCEACGWHNPSVASASAAAASRSSDGVRAADPVRRERLIDDDFFPYSARTGGGSSNSPLSMVGQGALLGGIVGAAGAYMRGRSMTSGALEGGVAGAMSGVFLNEFTRSPRRSSSSHPRGPYDNSLSEARSAGANGQPAYPVMGSNAHRRTSRPPRASVRVVSTPSADGTTTTIVSSSGRDGMTRIVRRSQDSNSGLDPVMSLMLHSMMQGSAGSPGRMSRFGGGGGDAIDRMSYEQLLSAFGDGSENLGASVGAISSLPTAKVKRKADGSIDLPKEARECSICLEAFEEGQIRKSLPCLHGFHDTCVDKWLSTNGACPVCKFRVDEGGSS